ncbi:hypothetical protein [Companilactobacillus mishanensis]|uniref:Uncharacterized protein n=1 Tax=Companilactobacillus mishanensis TaxID=2486008 RepID=A0A5P0ZF14_9LACO|nr:hypothetical protein [Companilactobacillus mishanensis]MQS44264.1 hypothetical protein [Companilactobacillus mishanensis]MQS51633.1 hypothetical protein [Companilactobacillus mishanensis]
MNYRKVFSDYLTEQYERLDKNMFDAIVWIIVEHNDVPPSFTLARSKLDTREQNEIIRDITFPF